jgi:hypothetical protein
MRALTCLLPLCLACAPDDVKGDSGGGDGGGGASGLALEGNWLSEGEDLSALFQKPVFDYKSIEATFNADLSYAVHAETQGGDVYDFAGTLVADESTSPASITLSQTSPTNATAVGIYLVEGDGLTYEVVQIDPDYGYTAPTPSTGFGSTSGPNLAAGENVQTYVRQ